MVKGPICIATVIDHNEWTPVTRKRAPKKHASKTITSKPASKRGRKICTTASKGKLRRMIFGPASETYFQIRQKCNETDDVAALKKLLPSRKHLGKDFAVWPTERPLLHGLVKNGCEKCVEYLVKDLQFGINIARADGCTPLHMAQYCLQAGDRQEMTAMLMKFGSDPSMTNKWGERPADLLVKPSLSAEAECFVPSYAVQASQALQSQQ